MTLSDSPINLFAKLKDKYISKYTFEHELIAKIDLKS
jgi:hypothetical protein